jgi:hypothetical protein
VYALNEKTTGGDGLAIMTDNGNFNVFRTQTPADALSATDPLKTCYKARNPTLEVAGSALHIVKADAAPDAVYLDPGAACYDSYLHCHQMSSPSDTATQQATGSACDKTMVPGVLTTSGQIVDVGEIGTYQITYTCTITYDGTNTVTTVKTREVVVTDMEKPVCAFDATHAQTITIEASFPYQETEAAPICTDDCGFDSGVAASSYRSCDPSQTKVATVSSSNVDVEQTGRYLVTYNTNTGSYGHVDYKQSEDIVRTVFVVDTLQPVIGLQFAPTEKFTTFSSNDSTDSAHTAAQHPGVNNPADAWSGWSLMAQTAVANGWMIAAAAAAVSGVALLATGKRTASSGLAELV